MADLKTLFRAKKAERGPAPPVRTKIKAAKARAAEQEAPTPAKPATASLPAPAPTSNAGIPSDFFDSGRSTAPKQPAGADRTAAQVSAVPSASGPVLAPSASAAPAPGGVAPLPAGFFDNKAADAKARGVKLPGREDKEAEFQRFQASMEEQLKDVAAADAEVAAEEAADKEAREEFEQEMRLQRLEELRQRKAGGLGAGGSVGGAGALVAMDSEAAPVELPAAPLQKRRRVMDALAAGSASDGSSSGGGSDSENELLDWRAKAV